MEQVPQELLNVYTQIVRQAPDDQQAGAHLLNFLLDVQQVQKLISDAVAAAKTRAGAQ